MSGVSSTSDINYYNDMAQEARRISRETEDEKNRAIDEAQTRHERHIDNLEEAHTEQIREIETESEEAIEDHREKNAENTRHQREATQIEVDELKRQLYGRDGKMKALEQREVEDRIKSIWSDAEQVHEKDRQAIEEQRRVFEGKVEHRAKQHSQELEDIAMQARESAENSYRKAYNEEKGLLTEYQDNLKNRYHSLNRERISELNFNKEKEHALQESLELVKRQNEDRRVTHERKVEEISKNLRRQTEDAVKANKAIFEKENRDLKKQVEAISDLRTDYLQGKNQGWQAAIKEADEIRQVRDRQVEDAFLARIDQLEQKNLETREVIGEKNINEQSRIKREAADMIREENLRHSREEQDQLQAFQENTDKIKAEANRKVDRMQRAMNRQEEISREVRENALSNQSQTYKKNIDRSNQQLYGKIDRLEGEVAHLQSTDDPNEVSQLAVDNAREGVVRRYEKILDQERTRNKEHSESMKRSYTKKINDTIDEQQRDQRLLSQKNALQSHQHKQSMLNYVHETEKHLDSQLDRAEAKHQRQIKDRTQNYMNDLESREHQFKESLASLRAENEARIQKVRDEADFRERMHHLEFVSQMDTMTRDYEKKLSEQKSNHEIEFDKMKKDMISELRASEKDKRDFLEAAERRHQQQVEQLQFQLKERERVLAQNYERQLEQARQANARLIRS